MVRYDLCIAKKATNTSFNHQIAFGAGDEMQEDNDTSVQPQTQAMGAAL